MGHDGVEVVGNVGNGGAHTIRMEEPFAVEATVEGTCPLLFHGWCVDAVEAKANARKGSRAKKEDDPESYVFRNEKGQLALPGLYFRGAIINAARFKQDPRSPRKSAMDLFKAAIVPLDELCSLGKKEWDYLDRRHAVVNHGGITRTRPAMLKGWQATFRCAVLTPEYVDPQLFHEVLTMAGRLIGVGDFRPTFGRFVIVHRIVSALT